MRWRRGITGAGFSLALLVLALVGITTYRSAMRSIQTSEWVAETHVALEQLADLQLHLTEAETGQRGYLITGDATYLARDERLLRDIARDLRSLHATTARDPEQARRLD